MHNESQDGKGPVNVHFATAVRHVDRYIEEKQMDVVVPLDLVNAINHGDCMHGCVGEVFEVDVKCEEALA